MDFSDAESSNDGEIFSEDDLEPQDLFNDEAEEDGEDKKRVHEEEKNQEEEAKVKVEKKRTPRVIKNPRVTLNFDTLRGSNGLSALKKLFKDFKFKGNGHEKEDLTRIMTILQQWMSYRLCPSYSFESCMLQLENLGRKKVVQTLMKKYRAEIDDWGEAQSDVKDIEEVNDAEEMARNEFDKLLDEEIAMARSDGEFSENEGAQSKNETQQNKQHEEVTLTQEQLERIARNRKLAEERRLKRLSAPGSSMNNRQQSEQIENQDVPEKILTDENS